MSASVILSTSAKWGEEPSAFDDKDRKLVINAAEAAKVRMIFERFVAIGSATTLAKALVAEDVRSKRGRPIDKGFLYKLLNNRVYLGEAVHKGTAYPGEHAAIVSRDLWDKVHAILGESPRQRGANTRAQEPALLKGVIFTETGTAMTPTATKKRGRLYRYYTSDGPDPEQGDGRRHRTAAPGSRNGRGRRRRGNSSHDPDTRGGGAHHRRLAAGNLRYRRAGDRLGARQLRSALARAVPGRTSAPGPTSGRARHDRRSGDRGRPSQ